MNSIISDAASSLVKKNECAKTGSTRRKNQERSLRKKELKLMFINKYNPKTPVLIQNSKASHLFNIFEGSGLEEVLDINSSVLASII